MTDTLQPFKDLSPYPGTLTADDHDWLRSLANLDPRDYRIGIDDERPDEDPAEADHRFGSVPGRTKPEDGAGRERRDRGTTSNTKYATPSTRETRSALSSRWRSQNAR